MEKVGTVGMPRVGTQMTTVRTARTVTMMATVRTRTRTNMMAVTVTVKLARASELVPVGCEGRSSTEEGRRWEYGGGRIG